MSHTHNSDTREVTSGEEVRGNQYTSEHDSVCPGLPVVIE
jgi:hypothetical protein